MTKKPSPKPLTYEQIDALARGIAIDLSEHEETAQALMVLMREISTYPNRNEETIANLLSGYLFMWQSAGVEAKAKHTETHWQKFLAKHRE